MEARRQKAASDDHSSRSFRNPEYQQILLIFFLAHFYHFLKISMKSLRTNVGWHVTEDNKGVNADSWFTERSPPRAKPVICMLWYVMVKTSEIKYMIVCFSPLYVKGWYLHINGPVSLPSADLATHLSFAGFVMRSGKTAERVTF